MDIFGVLHEGGSVFPGALDCLRHLKDQGKKVWLFSNSPRSAAAISQNLATRDVAPDLYNGIFSSGQDVRNAMLNPDETYKRLGNRFYHIGDPQCDTLQNTPLQQVDLMNEASFILLTGPKSSIQDMEGYEELLRHAQALALPVICANPDPYVILSGQRVLCAGTLALMYQNIGGTVYWHGKPHQAFYQQALQHMGAPAQDILAIGDSMWTDIAGASQAGIKSLMLTDMGVHRSDFLEKPLQPTLETFLRDFSFAPTFVARQLAP